MRAAAYIRVSHEEQKLHGFSLDAQREKITEYAARNNIKIVDYYIDAGISGKLPLKRRPELQRMICDRDNYDIILFIKLDRFFRSVAEYYKCMEILKKDWIATEEEYDTTTANGRFLITAKLAIAEMEADQTGERIRLTNEHKVRLGQPITGKQPFGYTIENKKVIKDPKTEEQVEEMFRHFMTFQSMRKTQIYIYEKYGKRLEGKVFKNILTNTMYYGTYRDNPNYCPSYITKQDYDKIQKIIGNNIKHNTHRVFLFTGLIKCPDCGGTMTCTTSKPHNKEYRYYRCSNHRKYRTCKNLHTLSEEYVEAELLKRFEHFFQLTKKKYTITGNTTQIDIKPLQEELDRLTYAFTKGRIDVKDYDRQYEELSHRIEATQKAQNGSQTKDYSKVEQLLNTDWITVYNEFDALHKRAFWRSLIQEIKVEWTDAGYRITDVIFV